VFKSSDAGNSDVPKESHSVLSKKFKILYLRRKKSYAEFAKIYTHESITHEIVKKEKEIHVNFLSYLMATKLWPQRMVSAQR
jgi:hypothetical protein